MKQTILAFLGTAVIGFALMASAQEAPLGNLGKPSKDEQKNLEALKGKINGKIVWSSSRAHTKHDLWIMNADGSDQKPLTNTANNVDWFPRFSPDGQTILFTRSISGWVAESDADQMYDKFDVYTIKADGTGETKVADTADWATWRPSGDSIIFARAGRVYVKSLTTKEEKLLFDADKSYKKGTFAQQPELSHNGKFLAVTLRGTTRNTVIWNLEKNEGYSLSGGCEVSWFPGDKRVVRMNEGQGNGSTEVLAIDIGDDGKPLDVPSGMSINKKFRFMDLPGRRSHEYFPTISADGAWMVWGATQYGHEHDIADYEIYVWKIGSEPKTATRLTFQSGNDRWPDIYLTK